MRAAVVDGEAIIERARQDHGLNRPLDDDGPWTGAWKQQRDLSAEPPPSTTPTEMVGHIETMNAQAVVLRPVWGWRGYGSTTRISTRGICCPMNRAGKHSPASIYRCQRSGLPNYEAGASWRAAPLHKVRHQIEMRVWCGAPYVGEHRWASPVVPAMAKSTKEPSALDRAAAAIAANPEKSNRALAAEIGVGLRRLGVLASNARMRKLMGHPIPHPKNGSAGMVAATRRRPRRSRLRQSLLAEVQHDPKMVGSGHGLVPARLLRHDAYSRT